MLSSIELLMTWRLLWSLFCRGNDRSVLNTPLVHLQTDQSATEILQVIEEGRLQGALVQLQSNCSRLTVFSASSQRSNSRCSSFRQLEFYRRVASSSFSDFHSWNGRIRRAWLSGISILFFSIPSWRTAEPPALECSKRLRSDSKWWSPSDWAWPASSCWSLTSRTPRAPVASDRSRCWIMDWGFALDKGAENLAVQAT